MAQTKKTRRTTHRGNAAGRIEARGRTGRKPTPASLAQAKAAGVPVIAYGAFLNDVVNFLIVAFAIFLIVKQANRFKKPAPVTSRACPKCLSSIPLGATRCAACCADL